MQGNRLSATGARSAALGAAQPDHADLYAAADLFIAPASDAEGQAVVLAEAFAARLCILATRVGGHPGGRRGRSYGSIGPPRNPQALADAIAKLPPNNSIRAELVENAFTKVKRDYPWEKVGQDFEDVYPEAIDSFNRGTGSSPPSRA